MATTPQPAIPAQPRPRFPLLEPLRIKNFTLFWVGETFSRFGDEFQSIALATVAIGLTGKASTLASVLMVQNIPYMLLLLYGGVVMDRFGAKRMMVVTDTLLGLVTLGLVVVAAGGAVTLTHLYIYAILVGLIRPFFQPASFSMPPTLVPRSNLAAANSLYRMGLDLSRFVAAPLAGAMVAGFGVAPAFAVNAYSFFQAAALQAMILQQSPTPKQPTTVSVWRQVTTGVQAVRDDPALAGAILFTALWYLGWMGAYSVGIAGLAQISLKAGPQGQGILLAAMGIGNLCGSVAAGSIRSFGKMGAVTVVCAVTYSVCFLLAGLASSVALCVPLMVVAGATNAFVYVAILSMTQLRAAPAIRGRVISILMLAAFGIYPFSLGLAGVVANQWGPRGVMMVLGAILPMIAAVAPNLIRPFRSFVLDLRPVAERKQ